MNDEAMKKNVDDTLSACIDYSTGLIGLKTMRTILETLYLKGRCNGMRYALDKKGKK